MNYGRNWHDQQSGLINQSYLFADLGSYL